MSDHEFDAVEERLRRYRPAGPSPSARARTEAALRRSQQSSTRRWRAAVAVVILTPVLSAVAWCTVHVTRPGVSGVKTTPVSAGAIPEAFAVEWAARSRATLPAMITDNRVVVVVFMDWQCPGCLDLYPMLASLVESYERPLAGRVSLVSRDYPWNARCNPYTTTMIHQAACEAAAAVRMARGRGREEAMIDWILADPDRLNDPGVVDRIRAEAERLMEGLDFDAEYTSALAAMQEDEALGQQLGVNVTPTVFVNGVLVPDLNWKSGDLSALDWAIRLELRRIGN